MAFITGTGEIERKLMVTYLNVSDTATAEWEAIGVKIEDSGIELNSDIEKVTDILGVIHTTYNKVEPQQSFEPFTIRKESKAAEKIFRLVHKQELTKLQEFEVLVAYGFDGAEGAFTAKKDRGCTIEVQSIGGSSRVDMPFNLHFSNDSVYGTVDKLLPASLVVFTED